MSSDNEEKDKTSEQELSAEEKAQALTVQTGVGEKTKLISPVIMLSATAIVAIYTFFQSYPMDKWLVAVLGTMVLFLILGGIIQKTVQHFELQNYKKYKEELDQLQQERYAEEEGKKQIAEAEKVKQAAINRQKAMQSDSNGNGNNDAG